MNTPFPSAPLQFDVGSSKFNVRCSAFRLRQAKSAAGQERTNLTEADVARAMSMVDYHYSYSPYLAWRVRLLAQRDDIARLCAWYGR